MIHSTQSLTECGHNEYQQTAQVAQDEQCDQCPQCGGRAARTRKKKTSYIPLFVEKSSLALCHTVCQVAVLAIVRVSACELFFYAIL